MPCSYHRLLHYVSWPPPATASSLTPSLGHPAELSFEARDLGDVGYATAVNDRGVVVGVRQFEEGVDRAFRRDARTGRVTDLGTLGGLTSQASDINDPGSVVGTADTPQQDPHAVRWDPRGRPTDLGTLGGVTSYAAAIDDAGRVAGWAETASRATHAFRWDPHSRRMTDLGTLGGAWSQALGLDGRGGVVGAAATADELGHAFRWDPKTHRMTDLGLLPGCPTSGAVAANRSGLVVGSGSGYADESERPACGRSAPEPCARFRRSAAVSERPSGSATAAWSPASGGARRRGLSRGTRQPAPKRSYGCRAPPGPGRRMCPAVVSSSGERCCRTPFTP
jgi:probable HAF family extracellular repeat protein